MRVPSGQYVVVLFDAAGSRTAILEAASLLTAQELGESMRPEGGSYSVLRCLYNSASPWRPHWEAADDRTL